MLVLLVLLRPDSATASLSAGLVDGSTSPAAQPLSVVASIFPLGDVTRRIGGDAIRVEVLLPPGAEPHGFEPKPAQAEMLAKADVLVTVGLGLDVWADRLAEAAGRSHLLRVELARSMGEEMPGGPTSDPHVWLDPVVMSAFTAEVARVLLSLRPDAAEGISARAAAYRGELDSLDHAYRSRLSAVPGRAFVTLHAAFRYIAARYGLNQVSLFDPEMHEPGPRGVERVIRFIRTEKVRAIFVQPQLPMSAVAALREETGVRVLTLDDLGNPLLSGYDSYLAMMRSNLDALVQGLGE